MPSGIAFFFIGNTRRSGGVALPHPVKHRTRL